jgi:D-sedoheptulose 7-phosphate isomerase
MKPQLKVIHNDALRQNIIQSLRGWAELRLQLIEQCSEPVIRAAECIYESIQRGGKVLVFGNGGSAADAQHLAGEFIGRFSQERPPLAAIALTTDTSTLTAIGNDYGFEEIFARQVIALGKSGDVAIGISTSGRSANVVNGIKAALDKELATVAFLGGDGGLLARMVDIPIVVPSTSTPRIQECHLTLEHIMCEILECLLNGNLSGADNQSDSVNSRVIHSEASTMRWLRCVQES